MGESPHWCLNLWGKSNHNEECQVKVSEIASHSQLSFLGWNFPFPQVLGVLKLNHAKLSYQLLKKWVIPSQGSLNQVIWWEEYKGCLPLSNFWNSAVNICNSRAPHEIGWGLPGSHLLSLPGPTSFIVAQVVKLRVLPKKLCTFKSTSSQSLLPRDNIILSLFKIKGLWDLPSQKHSSVYFGQLIQSVGYTKWSVVCGLLNINNNLALVVTWEISWFFCLGSAYHSYRNLI